MKKTRGDDADDEDGEETKRIHERCGCRKRGKKRKTDGMEKTRLTKRTMKQRRMTVKETMNVMIKAKDRDADYYFSNNFHR